MFDSFFIMPAQECQIGNLQMHEYDRSEIYKVNQCHSKTHFLFLGLVRILFEKIVV